LLANAALSLGLSGTDFLAQSLRGGLRLDEISIGSEPGEDAQLAKFTVGKYLSPKLYVSYGVGLFQPGHVFKLLYDLGHGFKVSTESGVQTGGDLLYSVERR
jgi:translocation and assembly module TamB